MVNQQIEWSELQILYNKVVDEICSCDPLRNQMSKSDTDAFLQVGLLL